MAGWAVGGLLGLGDGRNQAWGSRAFDLLTWPTLILLLFPCFGTFPFSKKSRGSSPSGGWGGLSMCHTKGPGSSQQSGFPVGVGQWYLLQREHLLSGPTPYDGIKLPLPPLLPKPDVTIFELCHPPPQSL